MLKSAVFLACLFVGMVLMSCEKPETYDREAQLKIDVDSITKFITVNKIGAENDGSGLFFQIFKTGEGKDTLTATDTLTVKYTGRLFSGAVFENPDLPVKLLYSGLIEGWQIGLKKIQKGGQIRLLIPSTMAYTNKQVGIIPANSCLDYTIELLNITKFKKETTTK